MPDISTFWIPAQLGGDWAVVGPDLASGGDLETALLISLFTDRRADPDDVIPDGSGDRRGWWGDAYEDEPIGSKLWLLERSKKTEKVRLAAKDYIDAALAWLVSGGIAKAVTTTVDWQVGRPGQGFLGARVQIDEPDGRTSVFNYQWAWGGLS